VVMSVLSEWFEARLLYINSANYEVEEDEYGENRNRLWG